MKISDQQASAIAAATQRVFPGLSERQLVIEIAWSLNSVKLDQNGYIYWRGMELGNRLLQALSEAQNWRCCYCGIRVSDTFYDQPTLEHVIPKSKNGGDHPDNLVMACYACNNARSNQDIEGLT